MQTFKVVKSKESVSVPGTYNHKIQTSSSIETPLGLVTRQETYYLRTDKEFEIGHEFQMDISAFNVIEVPYVPEGAEEGTEPIMLKKLVA